MQRPNRSHPTLSALTTYPTSPSASTSYLYPSTSFPTAPSILSRTSSQSRLRPSVSAPQAIPNSKSSSALHKPPNDKRSRRSIRNKNESEDDWLTRTASTLTLTRLEEKGQSWVAARNSSTSLTGGEAGDDEYYTYSPEWNRSQVHSQMGSQRGSRSRLQSRRGSMGGVPEMYEGELMGPDFIDVDEDEEDEDEDEDGEEVDEGEMRKIVMGRVGGWVDWAVGWMDFRGDGEGESGDEDEDEINEAENKGGPDPLELRKRLQKKKKRTAELESVGDNKGSVKPPPADEQAGTWSDAKWLLDVATKAAI